MRLRESQGVKNAALSNNPHFPLTPCLGLQKQDRLPQRTLPFCQPEGSSRQLRNSRRGIRQGLQLGGEFLPSSVLAFLLSVTGIPVFPVWLCCPPRAVF
ncbi:hypothetical protein PBY51_004119 [Eleginops maclovinus]|uniref:Uncharacterized protein n=1 Tax=Eleginops maclovinus TaxID=56733 RepID=A0AAN8AWW0_ELEMC|nr:hypothetical protein PBY51_004119 [Eleginops maclovinus]